MILALAILAVGDTWTAEIKTKFTLPEDDFSLEYDYRQTAKVIAVGKEITVRLEKSAIANRVDGGDIPIPKDNKPFVWDALINEKGYWDHGKSFSEPAEYVLQRLLDLPLNEPKPFVSIFEPNPKGELRITTGPRAILLKRPVTQIKMAYKDDDGMSASGNGWADDQTGQLLQLSAIAQRAPIPGGDDRATYTVDYKVTAHNLPPLRP